MQTCLITWARNRKKFLSCFPLSGFIHSFNHLLIQQILTDSFLFPYTSTWCHLSIPFHSPCNNSIIGLLQKLLTCSFCLNFFLQPVLQPVGLLRGYSPELLQPSQLITWSPISLALNSECSNLGSMIPLFKYHIPKPDWTICASHSLSSFFLPVSMLYSPPGMLLGSQILLKILLVHFNARPPLIFPFLFFSWRSSLALLNPMALYLSHNLLHFLSNFEVLCIYIHDLFALVEYKLLESRGHHWIGFLIQQCALFIVKAFDIFSW